MVKKCCGLWWYAEELRSTQEQLAKAESERTELAEQVTQLRAEVEDVKTAAAIQEFRKEDEIAKARRQHEEELASFQQIMEGIETHVCLVLTINILFVFGQIIE